MRCFAPRMLRRTMEKKEENPISRNVHVHFPLNSKKKQCTALISLYPEVAKINFFIPGYKKIYFWVAQK